MTTTSEWATQTVMLSHSSQWCYEHFGLTLCLEPVIGVYLCNQPKGHEGSHSHTIGQR